MILSSGLHSSLVKIHEHIRFIPGSPYEWDDKTFRVHILRQQRLWKVWLVVLLFLLVVNLYALGEYIKQGDFVSASTQFSCLLGITGMSTTHWFLCNKVETCSKFLNGMLDLEDDLKRQGVLLPSQSEMRIPKLLCKIMVYIEAIVPVFAGIGSGLIPCSPPNLVVPFNPDCPHTGNGLESSKSIIGTCVEFILLSVMNGIFWKTVVGSGTLWAIHILIGCKSQSLALKMIERRPEFNRRIHLINQLFNETYIGTLFVVVAGCSCALTAFAYRRCATKKIYLPKGPKGKGCISF